MRKRIGDTLVEVALAIGIFSMVAISVVAVVSGSSSGAQSSLETTVTREQIDAQAEALRFIHNSYIADVKSDAKDGDTSDTKKYTSLWRAMTSSAKNEDDLGENRLRAFLNPTTCKEIYDGDTLQNNHAFVVNTRKLGTIQNGSNSAEVIVKNKFSPPATYPRLVYNDTADTSSLADADLSATDTLSRVEGIYVIPVRDADSTTIITSDTVEHGSAYYDFYIMSCWYAGNSERPSTISTVVRLYDPDAITKSAQDQNYLISFYRNQGTTTRKNPTEVSPGDSISVPTGSEYSRSGYILIGWSTRRDITPQECERRSKADGEILCEYGKSYNLTLNAKCRMSSDSPKDYNNELAFYAVWKPDPYSLDIECYSGSNIVGGSHLDNVYAGKIEPIDCGTPTRANWSFTGWNISAPYSNESLSAWGVSTPQQSLTAGEKPDPNQNLYHLNLQATWEPNYLIKYETDSVQQVSSHNCIETRGDCKVSSDTPTKSGYLFGGWCTKKVAAGNTCSGDSINSGNTISYNTLKNNADSNNNVILYAIWGERNEEITILAEWTSNTDYDSYMQLSKPGGGYSRAIYSTRNINVSYNGRTYTILTAGFGDGRGSYNNQYYEKFVINTLGGKNYYYSIRKYPSGNIGNDITITVSGQYMGTKKFYSRNIKCSGNYWNVFAYKDGRIEERNTCSSSMEYGY